MLYNDYLEVNNRVIYVKEEMQRRFGAEIQPAAGATLRSITDGLRLSSAISRKITGFILKGNSAILSSA